METWTIFLSIGYHSKCGDMFKDVIAILRTSLLTFSNNFNNASCFYGRKNISNSKLVTARNLVSDLNVSKHVGFFRENKKSSNHEWLVSNLFA